MGSMTDLYFRGGPNDGLPASLQVEDDMEYLWFKPATSGKSDRYRRTDETIEIGGLTRIVFEYAPE